MRARNRGEALLKLFHNEYHKMDNPCFITGESIKNACYFMNIPHDNNCPTCIDSKVLIDNSTDELVDFCRLHGPSIEQQICMVYVIYKPRVMLDLISDYIEDSYTDGSHPYSNHPIEFEEMEWKCNAVVGDELYLYNCEHPILWFYTSITDIDEFALEYGIIYESPCETGIYWMILKDDLGYFSQTLYRFKRFLKSYGLHFEEGCSMCTRCKYCVHVDDDDSVDKIILCDKHRPSDTFFKDLIDAECDNGGKTCRSFIEDMKDTKTIKIIRVTD
jgi:hypothetical protein